MLKAFTAGKTIMIDYLKVMYLMIVTCTDCQNKLSLDAR